MGDSDSELREGIYKTSEEIRKVGEEFKEKNLEETIEELTPSNPIEKLYKLFLLRAIRDKASDIHFGVDEEGLPKMTYRLDGLDYEMVPPSKHVYQALGEEVGLMFGLVEERHKERTLMDKIKGRHHLPERVVTAEAFSNFRPKAKICVGDKPIDLTLVRGEYSENNVYHIKINYDVKE